MLTLETVRTYAKEIVADMGEDFVYTPMDNQKQGCFYDKETYLPDSDPRSKTGCLVGRILDKAEIEFDHDFGGPIDELEPYLNVTFEDGVSRYLKVLQFHQDSGFSWGKAIEFAEHRIPTQNTTRE